MAPKRPAKVSPPPSESDSEEETSSEEEAPTLKAASSAVVSKKPSSSRSESSSQSGSEDEPESESESDEENLKPIASKPMQKGTGKSKKQEKPKSLSLSPLSKPSASAPVKSGGKRVASETEDGIDAKKPAKKSKSEEGDALEEELTKTGGESKKLFQRVWNEDDEIAVLKGMVDFSSEKGADPCADMFAFHEFIKKSLHFDVSKVQLADKIRRLKKKYENNFGRSKNGKNPTFSKPHEERAFELSKKVWGGGGVSGKVVTENSKSKKDKVEARKKFDSLKVELFPPPVLSSGLSLCVTGLTRFQHCTQGGLDEQVVRRGVELMEPSKRAELEERWMVLQKNEIELAAKKAEIAMETARAIWEAYDDSSNN